ncbi:glycosyltransferase [Hymenobacter sp. BT188]|uniref:glycosyltransferase n=1 Tax=Hymenobacter sp. BT188 TaxID=2763504 RepID=UPI003967D5E1
MDPAHGGPSQGIRNSIPELRKLFVNTEVVCLDDPSAPFVGNDNFIVHALGPGKGPWHYSPTLVPWLLANLGRFDIVIVHGLWLYHSYAVPKALNIHKTRLRLNSEKEAPKLFIMPHGMLDPYFQKASSRRLKALRNWVYWKLIERKTINESDGVLFTCQEELQLARLSFWPYKPKREINISYGIAQPPPFVPALTNAFLERCPEVKSRPYILFLSRINEKKGVDLLITAYGEALTRRLEKREWLDNKENRNPEQHLCLFSELPALVIAGPGLESPYGHAMRQLAATIPVPTIFFPGMLTGDAKWGAFYGCEAFILPSHQENFGIAVVEALACSKPVLISNQVNIWREIEAAGAGLVADDTLEGTRSLLENWCELTESEKGVMEKRCLLTYRNHFAVEQAAVKMREALH